MDMVLIGEAPVGSANRPSYGFPVGKRRDPPGLRMGDPGDRDGDRVGDGDRTGDFCTGDASAPGRP